MKLGQLCFHFSLPVKIRWQQLSIAVLLLLVALPEHVARGQDQPAAPPAADAPGGKLYMPTLMRPYCPNAISLVLPGDGAALKTLIPKLNWSAANTTGADSVEILLFTNPERTGAPASYYLGPVATRQFQPPENLESGTTYYWFGRLVCGGVSGPDSKVWSFTTGNDGRIIAPPAPLKPADNAYVAAPVTIGWSLIVPALGYRWYVREPGSSKFETGVAARLEAKLDIALKPGTRYEWWVRTMSAYAYGPESTHTFFTVIP